MDFKKLLSSNIDYQNNFVDFDNIKFDFDFDVKFNFKKREEKEEIYKEIDKEINKETKKEETSDSDDEKKEKLEKFTKYKELVERNSNNKYSIIKEIGCGGYSNVYLAVNNNTNTKVAIKVINLFHTRGSKIKEDKIIRETKILQKLQGGPNIIQLLEVCKDEATNINYFVFEYIENDNFRELYPKLSDYDVRYYLYKVLQALEFAHKNNIMHRDIKPHNIVINHTKREIRLIDWGLAEFYKSDTEYNVKVSSKCFKGPELLLGYEKYDYSLDMWSFGCLMAGLIFKKEPFLKGKDDRDQLKKIVKVIGNSDFQKYRHSIFNIKDSDYDSDSDYCSESESESNSDSDADSDSESNLDSYSDFCDYDKKPLENFINNNNEERCSPEAINLLKKLLKIDHRKRILPTKAMQHKYFDIVRE
jgi:casein kinase II subunit alpha